MTNYMFMLSRSHRAALSLAVVTVLIASACSKKTPIPPPPLPAPVAGPTNAPTGPGRPVVAEFSVEPSSIERGQSAVLRWNVTGATNVAIDNGIGTVTPSGTRRTGSDGHDHLYADREQARPAIPRPPRPSR